MEFTGQSYAISVDKGTIQSGSISIEETKNNISEVFEELIQINDLLLAEMEGNIKTVFSSARNATESKIQVVTTNLSSMINVFSTYNSQNQAINMQANVKALGIGFDS